MDPELEEKPLAGKQVLKEDLPLAAIIINRFRV
jgi:hypothetical protein